ncbi:MAG: hypothetical protein ISR55_09490 [Bacteroidetes bacterium]|nr:hypothetical protein [Bacteroidota bacterium]
MSLPFIALFLLLVKKHEELKWLKSYYANRVVICEMEFKSLEGDQSLFDDGNAFIDPAHPYSSDMDLFGPNSICQYLNRSISSGGKIKLANALSTVGNKEIIEKKQHAIKELSERPEWRHDFRANGMMMGDDEADKDELVKWLKGSDLFYKKNFFELAAIILPILVLLSLILSFWIIPVRIPILFILLQLGIVGIFLRKINQQHVNISRKHDLIRQFGKLLSKIEYLQARSDLLIEWRSKLVKEDFSSEKEINKLSNLLRLFDNRLNMIAGFVLNGLFMWDIQCLIRMEKWKNRNKGNFITWLHVLEEYDALSSLANYAFNNPEFIYPDLAQEKHQYVFEGIAHPLIPPAERIANDFSINGEGQMTIVTGSNMAGKSTFLRSLGVNLILAMAGAPVCAKKFVFYPVQLFSNMRVGDDLSNRESTFYAELKRLKQIIEKTKSTELFILLDEILKGTNSNDKLTGSIALIRQLVLTDSVGVIATHDLALGKLEEELADKVRNFNFEVEIKNEEFHFDYKLKEGICKVLNATELMRKMGLKV